MKVVINIGKPKFSLTDKQIEYYAILKGVSIERKIQDVSLTEIPQAYLKESFLWYNIEYLLDGQRFDPLSLKRNDPILVSVIEKLNDGLFKIVEIPDDTNFIIEQCNGIEWVSEKHQTWGK